MADTKTIDLTTGETAVVRRGKGRDLLLAQRAAKDPSEISFGLMAQLVTINGEKKVLEDYLEMDLVDVLALQGAVMGNASASPAPNTSSTSPITPAGGSENSQS